MRNEGLCAALPAGELPELTAISRNRDVGAGEMVTIEGQDADAVFTLVSGMLKIYKTLPDGREQITGFATPGDVVGLAFGSCYVYTAEAVAPSTVCGMVRRGLHGLVDRKPRLQGRLLSMLSAELTAAQDQILMLGCKNATERVCTFLLALARRAPKDEQGRPVVFLPMKKLDMGGYLGLRPETISRVLRSLETKGLITRTRSAHIRIDDLDTFGDLAVAAE
ncbi:hypothetical protein TSO352_12100 [Azospirillum sp. TSO35-2]|nr:hypothetical protein TSO352_12100 [Azospirillum sp. TSO35-2]